MIVRIVGWQTDPRYRDILARLLRGQVIPLYRRAGCREVYVLHDEAFRHWRIVSFWEDEATLTALRAASEHRQVSERLRDFFAGPHEDRVFTLLEPGMPSP
jgi:quinol monooxygenase YgiN